MAGGKRCRFALALRVWGLCKDHAGCLSVDDIMSDVWIDSDVWINSDAWL